MLGLCLPAVKAESQSLKRIFQGAMRYTVPLYQRPYVWRHIEDDPENDRLGPFWEDVKQTVDRFVEREQLLAAAGDPDKLAPMTPHFFGAVVIDQPEMVDGGVVAHETIDGQQRLTTAQLLIAATARACDAAGRPKHASRLRKLWMQDDDLEFTGDQRFKLLPTRYDRKPFANAMDPDNPVLDGRDNVAAGYRYFVEQLAQWMTGVPAGEEDAYFNALRDTIYEQLLFVVIELQPGDNPQGIFESLNAQGERLLAIDLVKNHVFRRARHAELDLELLDTEVWSTRFGDEWWRADVKQGRYRRPRAELFLMHWLTERTEAEVSATGLFVEFSRLFSADKVDLVSVKGFIDNFVADAGIYQQFEALDPGSREHLFFSRREVLDIGVVYPVTLRLWRTQAEKSIEHNRLVTGLRVLESWLVRRMVMRLTTQNYNRVMLEVLKAMGAADDPVTAMIDHLRSFKEDTPTGWWPTDERFRAHLVGSPLYNSITQARVRMILEAAEARLHTPKTEKVPVPTKLSIEHVIPRSWRDTWPLKEPDDEAAIARRTDCIHRIGNLTLVTSSLNPALSNDPWAEKRSELARHSALRLNAQLVHDYTDRFDEDAIDVRGAALADLLIDEWPGPDADEWA
jgi:hypothetical protein